MERVTLEFPRAALIHRHFLTLRMADMNVGRHLGHDTLVTLLQEARVEALGAAQWNMLDSPSVVVDVTVIYQREARFPEPLVIETAVPAAEGKALAVYHRVANEAQETVATARITMLLLDAGSGRPMAIPNTLKSQLAQARGD